MDWSFTLVLAGTGLSLNANANLATCALPPPIPLLSWWRLVSFPASVQGTRTSLSCRSPAYILSDLLVGLVETQSVHVWQYKNLRIRFQGLKQISRHFLIGFGEVKDSRLTDWISSNSIYNFFLQQINNISYQKIDLKIFRNNGQCS